MIACLKKLHQNGSIDDNIFETLQDVYNKSKNTEEFKNNMDGIQASKQKQYKSRAYQFGKKNNIINDLIKSDDAITDLENLVVRGAGKEGKSANVEFTIKEYMGKTLKPLANHFDDLRSKMGGLKINTKLLDNVAITIFNKSAKLNDDGIAAGVVKAMEDTLKLNNDRLLANGITPNVTSLRDLGALSTKIASVSQDEFVDFASKLTKNSQEELAQYYKAAKNGDEVANFRFNSAEAEQSFRNRVGGDAFSNLINYIDRSSAKSAERFIMGDAKKLIRDIVDNPNVNVSRKEGDRVLSLLEFATGTNKQQQPGKIAQSLGAFRAIGTAAMMGSSPVTALLDVSTMAMTAKFNGLPVMKLYGQVIKNLVSKKSRMELGQLGFQLESVMSSLSQTSRFNPHSTSSDGLNKIATGVLRVSGLLAMSDAFKLSVKNTFLTQFRDLKGSTFDGLSKTNSKFKSSLERYNIKEDDWNRIRKQISNDTLVLNPLDLDDSTSHLVFRMINEEADYAVVTPGARSAYYTSFGGTEKGTIAGESARMLTQFKSTIVEQVFTHVMRAYKQEGLQNQMGYAATYFAATTIMGSMVAQLKEAVNNKTPINPSKDPLKFFSMAVKEGGALPIISDALAQTIDPSWNDKSAAEMLFSPAGLSTPYRIIEKGVKAAYNGATGDKKAAKKAAAGLASDLTRIIPGNNIWYFKELFNQMVRENFKLMIDPKGTHKSNRRKAKAMKKSGQTNII